MEGGWAWKNRLGGIEGGGDARLPSGLEPPAVLHRGAEGGGVESAQVGEKADEKSLVS